MRPGRGGGYGRGLCDGPCRRRTLTGVLNSPSLLQIVTDLRLLEPSAYLDPSDDSSLTAVLWRTEVVCHAARYGLSLHLDPYCRSVRAAPRPVTVTIALAEVRENLCWSCATLDALVEFFPEAHALPQLTDLLVEADQAAFYTPWQLVPMLRVLDNVDAVAADVGSRAARRALVPRMLARSAQLRGDALAQLRDPATQQALAAQLEPRFLTSAGGDIVALAVERIAAAQDSRPVEVEILDALLLGSETFAAGRRAVVAVPAAVLAILQRSVRPFRSFFRFSAPVDPAVLDVAGTVLHDALTLWEPDGDGPFRDLDEVVRAAARLNR